MSRNQQRLIDYLLHIAEAIERIHRYTEKIDQTEFLINVMTQDAVIRNLEIIGEASNNIEKHHPEFAAEHAELPLAHAYQMRNAITHGYFQIDLDIVWKTIQSDLHTFYKQIQEALSKLNQRN